MTGGKFSSNFESFPSISQQKLARKKKLNEVKLTDNHSRSVSMVSESPLDRLSLLPAEGQNINRKGFSSCFRSCALHFKDSILK